MGQAKQRGTFEQRVAWAQVRDKAVTDFVNKSDNKMLKSFAAKMGITRLAQWLEQTGQLQLKKSEETISQSNP